MDSLDYVKKKGRKQCVMLPIILSADNSYLKPYFLVLPTEYVPFHNDMRPLQPSKHNGCHMMGQINQDSDVRAFMHCLFPRATFLKRGVL